MDKKSHPIPSEMRLFDTQGQRLYCNAEECALFLEAARKYPPNILSMAEVLHYTGCRVSELLKMTPQRIDL